MKNKKYSIIYSSLTGNTKVLADAIHEALPQDECEYFGVSDPFFRTALYRILDRQGKCRYQDITAIIAVKEQTDFSVWNCRLWWQ